MGIECRGGEKMTDGKGKIVSFKADEKYLDMIDGLSKTLNLDRSKTIRIALDDAMAKYNTPEYQGDLVVINPEVLGRLLVSYMAAVRALE